MPPKDHGAPQAPIAVVGMSLRVPGARTLDRYWRNLVVGHDALKRASAASLRKAGLPQRLLANPDFVRALPALDDVEHFDADFFDMSAREAELTDPSHRLFLECAWEALESAGIVAGRDAPRAGVFGGYEGDYRAKVLRRDEDLSRDPSESLPVRIGNSLDFLTTRVSHKLDLKGPSFGVLAACATSLMAVDLAVQSLRRGECDVALAGGSTVLLPQIGGYVAGVEGMLSPSGRLRPFDDAADGTIFGSGVGVVALRPLADALAAGNPIHAVIRGSASSNDGNPPGKESFIAPSPEGQIVAIEAALRDAGISPATIGLVEAHGTGTRLGDPVEVASLTEVYRRHTDRKGFCSIGSVKGNIGHTRCGAGIASLIKACLALEHRTLPPLANFQRANRRIDFGASPFYVHTEARPWAESATPRRAAVSSFGFGGSNVHVIVEEHRAAEASRSSRRVHLLPLSARTVPALGRRAGDLEAHLDAHPSLAAADVAHTLQAGRRAFAQRAVYLAEGERIASPAATLRHPVASGTAGAAPASPVFLFPGQGAQRRGAGRGLYRSEPVFRDAVDRCAALLDGPLGLDVRELLGYVDGGGADAAALLRTANAQPALFVVGYASAQLLMSRGVTPAAMLGHSLGEIVAACLAGVFSLEDALTLVAARARLMQACEPGAMAAVFLPEAVAAERLPKTLEIAAVNAPSITVVSGPAPDVAAFCATLEREGLGSQRLETSHAFHSRMMEPALPAFERVVAGLALSAPRIPVISNATGRPLTPAQACDPRYWADHIRHPVRFSPGVEHALALGEPAFVELGPGSTLGDLVRRHDADARVFAMFPAKSDADSATGADAALAGLWCAGVDVDWNAANGEARPAMLPLPTYPFERMRHWREPDDAKPDPRKTLYERSWRDAPLGEKAPRESARPWLVFGPGGALSAALRRRLADDGARVVALVPGERFARVDAHTVSLRPGSRDDWRETFAELAGDAPPRILHLGSITGSGGPHNSAEAFTAAVPLAFDSLVALTQGAHDHGAIMGLRALVVADGLVRLDGEPGAAFAEKAALIGTCRDIPYELPGLSMRVVDVPCHDAEAASEWLVDALLDEAGQAAGPSLVALRPGVRRAEQLYPLPALAESEPRLRENGVVLVTGGTGGLGLAFAGALYDLCRARLVLTAHWTPPPEAAWPERAKRDDKIGKSLAGVLALRARGAEVHVVDADIATREGVVRAVEAARSRFGTINGLIHAAGSLVPSPVVDKTSDASARVFGAKVLGGFHLDELLHDTPLDLYLQVASQASQFPEPGQCDYAAANAVLDALAQNRARRMPGLAHATGWGPWREIGLAADQMRGARDAGADRAASRGRGAHDVEFAAIDHPILKVHAREDNGDVVFRGVLRRGHWIVEDHLLDGRPLLSGTTHLQLARTAFLMHAPGEGAVELSQVVFERPLFTADHGTEIEIRFTREGDGEAYRVRSRPLGSRDEWEQNSSGFAKRVAVAPKAVPPMPPREAWASRTIHPRFGSKHLAGGPRWFWRRQDLTHEGQMWGRLELPAEFANDLDVFDTHPALLDGATAGGARGVLAEAVPHTYDAIRFFAPLETEVFAVASLRKVGATSAADIQIVDAGGRTLCEVDGYVMRPIAGSTLDRDEGARGPRRMVVGELGDLGSLRAEPIVPRAPGPGEVQIEVRATGLNFRDVLSALGQLPGAENGFAPGGEVSGVVTALGPGVRHLAVGDPVLGIARGSIATHVTVPANGIAVMPASLDFNRAAGIPIVFLTAVWALEHVAQVKRGERVLIHAATGGVGLAAVQIARKLGAEIHATAGSEDKREYLRAIGITNVYDSRSLAFVDGIRAATGGEGVDVVLNALTGEFIPASLDLLRPQGRFVEIGKRDLVADAPLGLNPFLRNLSFTAFDLGWLVDAADPRFPPMFDTLMDRFACGELKPLPTSSVPFAKAEDGFRKMARAQHIGKIVFEVRVDASSEGALERTFDEIYGNGIPVAFGLDVFRRTLCWTEPPAYVLCMGLAVESLAALAARPRGVGASRGRDMLKNAYRAPRDDVEKSLARLWEKTLGIAPIGIDDDFIDLGGDSIEAIQIQHAIQRDFELRIKNTEFLAEPTIAALAQLIAMRMQAPPEPVRARA